MSSPKYGKSQLRFLQLDKVCPYTRLTLLYRIKSFLVVNTFHTNYIIINQFFNYRSSLKDIVNKS